MPLLFIGSHPRGCWPLAVRPEAAVMNGVGLTMILFGVAVVSIVKNVMRYERSVAIVENMYSDWPVAMKFDTPLTWQYLHTPSFDCTPLAHACAMFALSKSVLVKQPDHCASKSTGCVPGFA